MSRPDAPAVQFGIFDWIDHSKVALADIYDQRLELLAYADQAGYYCYHVAEHHGTPLGMAPSPSVFLAAAAKLTRRIRLGPMVYIVPLYHPVRLAEEICMLDHLSRGRLELGVGRGSTPYELAMLGVDVDETRERYREGMEVILAALTTGEVSYRGRYYTFEQTRLALQPYQRPYPPLWYPTSNPETVAWVAEQGYHTLFSFNTPTPAETRRRLDIYKQSLPRAANNPNRVNPHVTELKYGIVRKVYVAETDAEALRVARTALADFRDSFTYLWELHGVHRYYANLADFADCLERGVLFPAAPGPCGPASRSS